MSSNFEAVIHVKAIIRQGVVTVGVMFFSLLFLVPEALAGKKTEEEPVYENQVLDTNIRTVEFYLSGGAGDVVADPIKPLGGDNPLVLEFDWMGEVVPYMNARIIHCNYDWTKSSLIEIDYIPNINEYPLNDLEQSSNTFVPYAHLRFEVPRVNLTGNYILQVYNEDDQNEIFLNRRFVVYKNQVVMDSKLSFSSVVSKRNDHHQIDFALSYGGLDVTNPVQAFRVVVLQNGRWDNALTDFIPTAIRHDQKLLTYDFFAGENNFLAGNEFRAIDLRSNRNEGLGVETIDRAAIPRRYDLYDDTPKTGFAYSDSRDMEGKFVIANFKGDNKINSDYVHVDFTLKTNAKYDRPVYIFGGLSYWKLKDSFRMEYNEEIQAYTKRLLLKQGYYNYLYAMPSTTDPESGAIDFTTIDGSYQQTTNDYTILVYLRRFGFYHDEVVGYGVIGAQ